MKIYLKVFVIAMLLSSSTAFTQVGMVGNNPHSSAVLDINDPHKGLLISSFTLSSTIDKSAFGGNVPAQSLLIYNDNSGITGVGALGAGYYYWDTDKWKKLLIIPDITPPPTQWSITGNASTDPGIHFLGTTDGKDFIIKTQGNERMRATAAGAVGIGITAPANRLAVDAARGISFQNLPATPATVNSNFLETDPTTGNLSWSGIPDVLGQQIRVGLNSPTYNQGDNPLRFNSYSTAATMGNTPAGTANFVNTIKGSVIATNQFLPSGNGTVFRSTDFITLPAGVYRISVRLGGRYLTGSGVAAVALKIIVNNNEYAACDNVVNSTNSSAATGLFTEVVVLDTQQNVDFIIAPNRYSNFSVATPTTIGSGKMFGSFIMIEKLR